MSSSQPGTQDNLLDGLLSDFLDESDQLLAQLNESLLELDQWARPLEGDHQERCDENLLNEMFRAAHSIKGLSAMLGLADINNLTHKIENVFDAARRGELTVTSDVTELMFLGLDQLTALIELLKEPGGEPVECDAVLEAIRRLLQSAGAERKQTSQADAERAMNAGSGGAGPGQAEAKPPKPEAPPEPGPLEGIQDDGEIPEKYLSIFIDEAQISLESLTGALLSLESGGGGDALKGALCTAHKIKGAAAAVGLNRIAKMAHLMEDLLEEVSLAGGSLSAAAVDRLLKCTDALQQRVDDLKRGAASPDPFDQLARELLAAQAEDAAAVDGRTAFVGEVKFQPGLPMAALKAQLIYEKLDKLGEVDQFDPPYERLDEIEELDGVRFQVTCDQPLETVIAHLRVSGVQEASVRPLRTGVETSVVFRSAKEQGFRGAKGDNTTDVVSPVLSDRRAGVQPGGKPPQAEASPSPSTPQLTPPEPPPTKVPASGKREPPVPSGAAAPQPARETRQSAPEIGQRPTETVRVDIDRLDHLMDLAGQLVINKAQFSRIGDRLKGVLDCKQSASALDKVSTELAKAAGSEVFRLDGGHRMADVEACQGRLARIQDYLEPIRCEVQGLGQARDLLRELFETIHQLDRVSDGIQQSVMDTRMVPIGPLFARFKRVVRDVTRANGKQIRLEIRSEKTELDKRMIDELGDPLVHMVRNAADHGIESPDEREAAGKPREGTVTLDALHRGNSIVIQVRDDGKGLDTDRILKKCLEKGLLSEADAARMTPHQVHQMIWEPGLSTAEQVTNISGRGMGMDIVKSRIDELSGTVEIESVAGQGTTITVKLPLTLAILPSLMVDVAGDVFAMPMEAVVEIVSVGRKQMSTVHGRQIAIVRGQAISVVRLGAMLRFHQAALQDEASARRETTLVIVGERGQEIGLAVDHVIGEEDVVIKSIAENYKNVTGIAGASILGDGRVSLILDIPALIGMAAGRGAASCC